MSNTDDLRKLNEEIKDSYDEYLSDLEKTQKRIETAKNTFENAGEIISDLDKEFATKTGILNSKDMSLLFVATGLLSAKWIIMGQALPLDFDFKYEKTPTEDRLTDKEGDKLADEKLKNSRYGDLKDEHDVSSDGYRTVNQIIFRPVPYDAMTKIDSIDDLESLIGLDNLNGRTHRAYTMGHDPIWGWIFGTINIMTRSITLKNPTLDTYSVTENYPKIIRNPQSNIFREIKNAVSSTLEDHNRLAAAVFKQGLHFLSDKYTKDGLPIPLLSAEKAKELIDKGWNSVELGNAIKKFIKKSSKLTGTVALQFSLSFLINLIIKAIHLMLYNEQEDGDITLYEVRTRRILRAANAISSSSNLLVSAGIAISTKNVMNGMKKLDIGGYIETIHRLITDTKFITDIKREYIVNNFEKIALGYDEFLDTENTSGGKNMAINKGYIQGADDVGKIAAKAIDLLEKGTDDAIQKQKELFEKQGQINVGILNNQDSMQYDIDLLKFGYKPIDMKAIYQLPASDKIGICSLLMNIQCESICKDYVGKIIALLGVAPTPSEKDIPALKGTVAHAAAEFIYKIIALSDYNESVSLSAQNVLDSLEISRKDLNTIESQVGRLKEAFKESFSDVLFDELSAPEKFERKATKVSVVKRPISAIVVGKSGSRAEALIQSIYGDSCSKDRINDSISYYSDEDKLLQIYKIPEVKLGSEENSKALIEKTVEEYNANVILYCVNVQSHRFEDYEINLVSDIKHKYKNIALYIILTGCVDIKKANELADYIRIHTNKNKVFLVLEKDHETDIGICRAFGVKEMLEEISND